MVSIGIQAWVVYSSREYNISKVQQNRLKWQGTDNSTSSSSLSRFIYIEILRISTEFSKFYDNEYHQWPVDDSQQYSYRNTRIWMLPWVVLGDRQQDEIIIPSQSSDVREGRGSSRNTNIGENKLGEIV